MASPSLEVVIPVSSGMCAARKRNLLYILGQLPRLQADRVLLAEMSPAGTALELPGFEHLPRVRLNGEWNKSAILNEAIAGGDVHSCAQTRPEWLLVLDADIVLEWEKVRQDLAKVPADGKVIMPCGGFTRLDEADTINVLAGRARKGKGAHVTKVLCGGAFLIKRDTYCAVRGFDERLKFFEDAELRRRAQAVTKPQYWNHLTGLHLYHPVAKYDKRTYSVIYKGIQKHAPLAAIQHTHSRIPVMPLPLQKAIPVTTRISREEKVTARVREVLENRRKNGVDVLHDLGKMRRKEKVSRAKVVIPESPPVSKVAQNLPKVQPPAAPCVVYPWDVTFPANLQDAASNMLLVVTYSYEDPLRHNATVQAVRQICTQRPFPVLAFTHLDSAPDEELKEMVAKAGGHYLFIEARPEHADIFHKEDLWNYTIRKFPDVDVVVGLDADTYPLTNTWAGRCAYFIQQVGDDVVHQPWRCFKDTRDSSLKGDSYAWEHLKKPKSADWKNPGLCVGMTRATWERIGGFPLSAPAGAGDTFFLEELGHTVTTDGWRAKFTYFKHARRTITGIHPVVHSLDEVMVHVHHGTKCGRNYQLRHVMLQGVWPWYDELYIDDEGLLCVQPGSAMQYALHHRKLATPETADQLIKNALQLRSPGNGQ